MGAATRFDVVVIGAGAAGLFCAAVAGQRGARVLVLDHAARLCEKIRISGGGRCNFTNRDAADPARFAGADPAFALPALKAYPPQRITGLLRRHGVGFHEKHRGQLFCDRSSQQVIDMLRAECGAGGVVIRHPVRVLEVGCTDGAPHPAAGAARAGAPRTPVRYRIATDAGDVFAGRLVVASGGLSIPALGASGFAFDLARRFGIPVEPPRPALVPFSCTSAAWAPFAALSGVAVPVRIGVDGIDAPAFDEDLLFTHRGLSGPAALQASTYWLPGHDLRIDLLAGREEAALAGVRALAQSLRPPVQAGAIGALARLWPRRLAQAWVGALPAGTGTARLPALARDWRVRPAGTEGYRKAEVTAGGVATAALDPATLEVRGWPGLHFIGECVDVTGWLGGYNFQWAWASGHAAGLAHRPAD